MDDACLSNEFDSLDAAARNFFLRRKNFFFEKKKQKTFVSFPPGTFHPPV